MPGIHEYSSLSWGSIGSRGLYQICNTWMSEKARSEVDQRHRGLVEEFFFRLFPRRSWNIQPVWRSVDSVFLIEFVYIREFEGCIKRSAPSWNVSSSSWRRNLPGLSPGTGKALRSWTPLGSFTPLPCPYSVIYGHQLWERSEAREVSRRWLLMKQEYTLVVTNTAQVGHLWGT